MDKYTAILVPEKEQKGKEKEYILAILDKEEDIRHAIRLTYSEVAAIIVLIIDMIKITQNDKTKSM